MKRAVGFLFVAVLIGGAVWIGLRSERPDPPARVSDVQELAGVLSHRGFGCGHAEEDFPGFPPPGADVGICMVRDSHATLYVFEDSSASFVDNYDMGTKISWVVGHNWVVVLDYPEAAIALADALGADVVYDPVALEGNPPVASDGVAEGMSSDSQSRSGRTFGWGVIPAGDPRLCLRGRFEEPDADRTRVAARRLLRATNTGATAPMTVWKMLTRPIKDAFGYYATLARRMRHLELRPSYWEWEISKVEVGPVSFMPEVRCGERVLHSMTVAQVSFPEVEGVSGAAVQLYFVARRSGPRLWFAY
jgi:hypothetical protein